MAGPDSFSALPWVGALRRADGPVLGFAIVAALAPAAGLALSPTDSPAPDAAMLHALTTAESMLARDEPQSAESWYRTTLLEGWLLLGDLHRAEGDGTTARTAYHRALASALEVRRPLLALAELALERGEPDAAADHLRRLLARGRGDGVVLRLLARAFDAGGAPELAVQQLERAVREAPNDPESHFALATGYLRLGRAAEAAELFDEVAERRPGPRTWILVGATYRDAGEHDRSRAALERALELDPEAPRAHHHLGLLALASDGGAGVEAAIESFERERRISPDDPTNALFLGMALVESRRFEEALVPLEVAARAPLGRLNALMHRGEALLGLDRPADAVTALEGALQLTAGQPEEGLPGGQMESLHYQLALALRRAGRGAEAGRHFAAAERYSEGATAASRDRLASYLEDRESEARGGWLLATGLGDTAASGLGSQAREMLRERTRTTLARASFNLGVMATQAGRFALAADHFGLAATVQPGFPRVQYSLGVTSFNAGRFETAAAALSRAMAETPGDLPLRRMLALAWLNVEHWDRAAELLAADPGRAQDRSLQYAFGMALVRSGRTAEAQPVFAQLLDEHADWPELNVLLGQAAAQEGDFEAAERHLERAVALEPEVAEARAALGHIRLRQGRLAEAATALRAELRLHPGDHRSRHVLATVLELDNQPDDALAELDLVLAAVPDFASARYLRGRILLEQGRVSEAAAQLVAASELAPEDPNIRNQLGRAYQRLGEREKAQEQFDAFRALKDAEDDQ